MSSNLFLALKRRKLLVVPLVLLSGFFAIQYWDQAPERTRLPPSHFAKENSPSHDGSNAHHAQYLNDIQTSNGFDWAKLPETYPVTNFAQLPTGDGHIPKIQAAKFRALDDAAKKRQTERLAAVKDNFSHAWQGYRKHAWLRDEVGPLSGTFHDPFGGWGATLVDALGSLWIMGMTSEFDEAVKAIERIDFSTCALDELNVFETTIRYLGGFLSAYDLGGGHYPSLLKKATELGEMLYHAFDTPNRMPVARWDFKAALKGSKQEARTTTLLAELGSLTLEFTRLSQLTGNMKFYDAVQRIADVMDEKQNSTGLPGMWPVIVNANAMDFTTNNHFTIGGMADSAYEYLPKQYLLLGGTKRQYKKMYEAALKPIKRYILYRPMTPDRKLILLPGQVGAVNGMPESDIRNDGNGQHLACFAGGMLGLGAKIFGLLEDLEIAREVMEGCLWAYESMVNGIMPEVFHTIPCPTKEPCPWKEDEWTASLMVSYPQYTDLKELIAATNIPKGMTRIDDASYLLRPEAIESVFYQYRLTGDESLRDRAWKMFENIIRVTKTPIAHAAIIDCSAKSPKQMDKMESFWLAETLRYFYLIFSDPHVISLDEWVLNTEAHPFKRP